MKIDLEALIRQEEALDAALHEADEWYLERLRARVFPTPSPFGVDWEKQRLIEAYNLLVRWSRGRKANGWDLREFKQETLRMFRVLFDCL